MQIVEIFTSKQGEGLWTGVESAFVRVGGCLLCCRFCDTPYAFWNSGEAEEFCVEEIVDAIEKQAAKHVVLTGGEPMLYAELIPLTEKLKAKGYTITIETSGTLDLPVHCDLMSISPKLSNSTPRGTITPAKIARHETNRNRPEVVRNLIGRYAYQLKFVVDTQDDITEIETYLRQLPEVQKNRVLLMPQGTDSETLQRKSAWIREYCRQNGFQLCPRMHIEWFGNQRGK